MVTASIGPSINYEISAYGVEIRAFIRAYGYSRLLTESLILEAAIHFSMLKKAGTESFTIRAVLKRAA